MLAPFRAMGHHPRVARAYGQLEQRVPRWRWVDVKVKDLADLAAAVKIGCPVVHGLRLLGAAHLSTDV